MTPILFTISMVVVVCIIFYYTEKFLLRINFNITNEVLGIYFNVVGVLYTLILAFVVVNVWQNYQTIVIALEEEAHQLMDIRHAAEGMESAHSDEVVHSVIEYANAVRLDEWAKMAENEQSDLANEKLDDLLHLRSTLVADTTHSEYVEEVCSGIKRLRELRHERLILLHSALPTLLWIILFAGSVLCVFLSFLLHVKNIFWQTLLTTIMTSMLAMVLLLIFSLSHPFEGSTMIDTHPFEEVELGEHQH